MYSKFDTYVLCPSRKNVILLGVKKKRTGLVRKTAFILTTSVGQRGSDEHALHIEY